MINLIEAIDPDNDWLLYHGTATPLPALRAGLLYLTSDEEEAAGYALNYHRPGVRPENPSIHLFAAKPGRTENIEDDAFMDELENGDIEQHIIQRAAAARKQGYRYLTYDHPSSIAGNQEQQHVMISLYPDDDLQRIG